MVPDLGEAPVFDETLALEMLEEDRELLGEIVEIFRDSTAQILAALRNEIDVGDLKEVARLAHSIKGSAANVCAERIRILADALEDQGDRGIGQSIGELHAALEEEFHRFQHEFEVNT